MNQLPALWEIGAASISIILAVGLVIVEVIVTSGFFLSFAASALIVAAKVALLGASLLTDALIFAALSVLLVVPFRAFLRRFLDRTKDINDL